jgi:hypothetical protein
MGWLIGIGLFFGIIWLMVVSPAFRYLILLIGAGIAFWIYGQFEESKKQQAQREIDNAKAAQAEAAYEAKAQSLLKPSDLSFSNVALHKYFGDEWSLAGTVTNRGSYELSSVSFKVKMQDCSSECVTIGESPAIARVSIPAGQARAFQANVTFSALPQAPNPRWAYTITTISAVPKD